ALLVLGTVPLLLGFTWAGTQFAWLSAPIVGLFALAVVSFAAFVSYELHLERTGGQPIIEPSLFRNAVFSVSTVVTVIFGFGMGFGMSLYTLIVQNALPTKIGQATAAMTFFRQIGATIGLAAMGSVLTSSYPAAFNLALPPALRQSLPLQVLVAFGNPQL